MRPQDRLGKLGNSLGTLMLKPWGSGLVDQILPPKLTKAREIALPFLRNLRRSPPRLELLPQLVSRRQTIKAVIPKLKLARMRRANCRKQRDGKLRRVIVRAIRDAEAETMERQAAVLAIRRRDRSEQGRLKCHTH